MKRRLEFTIPLLAIGFGPNDRVHWSTRAVRAKALRAQVGLYGRGVQRGRLGAPLRALLPEPLPMTLRYTVIWAKGKRRLNDADNLIAQLKPCTDGLKDAGLIHDDSPDWLTLLPVEQRKGSQAMISIQIELSWLRTLSGTKK